MSSESPTQTTPTVEEPQQQQQQQNNDSNASNTTNANTKRKPSRRANTAERRATHNAVERARRETLNSRFLDLAALLPNLSQIRRPSKSAIVNSSIAHIHASRRHRLLSSRELRALKAEADALRRELNEWRDRAALPRIEEPQRGEGFSMVLSGELEVINIGNEQEEELEDDAAYGDDIQPQQPFYHEPEMPPQQQQQMYAHQGPPTPPTSSHGHPHQGGPVQLQQMMPRAQQNLHPMVVNTSQVHFDPSHPANMHGMPQFGPQSPVGHFHHDQQIMEQEKAWSMGFAAAQRSLQNPPNTGSPNGPAFNPMAQGHQNWDLLNSDDSSSASSRSHDGRARSHSLSTGFGSPPRSPGSFELGQNGPYDAQGSYDIVHHPSPNSGSDYGVPRGLTINTSGIGGMGAPMVTSPVNNGGGFGNVMMGMM